MRASGHLREEEREEERARERKTGALQESQPELLFVIGNDGRVVWGPHGFDPVTARSRENRVRGHVSLSPSHRHTQAPLHVHTHALTLSVERQNTTKAGLHIGSREIIIPSHQCMWTRANYAAYKAPPLKVSRPSMFCLGFHTLPSPYSHSI